MTQEIVHLAGPLVTYDGVKRQRCVWCGALIAEMDLSQAAVAIQPDESEEHAVEGMARSHWEGFVAVEGNVRWAVKEPEDGRAPDRSCMRVDGEVTA